MFTSLDISGFRAFSAMRIEGMGRVNLFVGENNSGKTSVLDAIQVLAADGHPAVLGAVAMRRGGRVSSREAEEDSLLLPTAVRYLFNTASPVPGTFVLEGEALWRRRVVAELFWTDKEVREYPTVGVKLGTEEERYMLPTRRLPTNDWEALRRAGRHSPVQYVSPAGATARALRPLWNRIVGNSVEKQVLEAIQLLDPQVEAIAFAAEATESQFFVRRRGEEDRVPMETLGDGIRRLLEIAIRAVLSRDGYLLLDEVDGGLHHRLMEKLWAWLIPLARNTNMQVIATTHSNDCVRALGWLHRKSPELVADAAVFRIERMKRKAIWHSAEEIDVAIDAELEVRG